MKNKILIIDDDEYMLKTLSGVLTKAGYPDIHTISDPREVAGYLFSSHVNCMILDLSLPYISGEDILAETVAAHPEIPVLILTSSADTETVVRCMRAGAADYLIKPIGSERIVSSVKNLLTISRLNDENNVLRDQLMQETTSSPHFSHFISTDERIQNIFGYIEKAALSPYPFLITGETGTGKELIAQGIHSASGRKGKLIAINASGLDDTALSDTLFGHVKGAYTSAISSRKGFIKEAENGTLFLDEIGDISSATQMKLLRLLQSGEYYALGSDVCMFSNARIITATNRNLPELIENKTFRNDLFYRLRTHWVDIPPLRKRKKDIPALLEFMIKKSAKQLGKSVPSFPRELIILLSQYDFPGNVRELEGMISDAVASCSRGILSLDTFKEKIKNSMEISSIKIERRGELINTSEERFPTINDVINELILKAMERASGNQGIAASMLGITRQTLSVKLRSIRSSEKNCRTS